MKRDGFRLSFKFGPGTHPGICHWTWHTDNRLFLIFFSVQGIYVGKSSGSKTIQSPNYNGYYYNYYPTSSSRRSCSFEIDTAEGYVLRLTFVRVSILSCSGCSCGYVQVYEGSSGSSLLGKFCSGHYPTTVTTRSNKMSVFFYRYYHYDEFKATIVSEKGIKF